MDYLKIYNSIIERAKNRQLEGCVEKHHIIPRCLGGNNEKENIVVLTAREHFLCHLLLCEIYPKNNKLRHAIFLMSIGKNKKKEIHYIIGGRTYERLKKEYSKFLLGKKQTELTRKNKSKKMLEVWKNKSKEEMSEIGKKRWITRIKNNKIITEKTKENISKSLKGRKITWERNVSKPIIQYDLQDNFIKEWSSIAEAKRNIKGDITAALLKKQKTAGGFKWKYKNK